VELPAASRSTLQAAALAALVRSLQLAGDLKRIAATLAAAERPIVVLKGPALVQTIYPSAVFRPFTDIDLVVKASDEAAVAGLLGQLGYSEQSFVAQDWWRAHGHHVHDGAAFHRTFMGDRQRLVELHADPLQLGIRPACEAGRWQRAVPVPQVPGALMLGPADQLVQLSVHLHKHGFSRLIWVKDLDLLLRNSGEKLDWELIEAVARAEGVTTSIWHSLRLAGRLLQTPVPPQQLARFRPALLSRVLDQLVWPTTRSAALQGTLRRRAVQFDAAESWRGMLPGLVLMGRRRERARALLAAVRLRLWSPAR
jgi:putative nucleotidyltransferase-like protein